MNKTFLLAIVFVGLLAVGCGGERSKTSSVDSLATERSRGPLSDSPLDRTYTAQLGGQSFAIRINRTPAKDLATVTDELGQKFYDNRVEVTVTSEGREFFKKTFTKEAFADYLKADDKTSTVLMGMAYDEEKSVAGRLCLAAQVGKPGTGEGPAFTIEIPTGGAAYSIVRDEQQDTNAEESGDEGD